MSETVSLIRPYGIDKSWHIEQWVNKHITVLITQRKTLDLTRLCLESLLRFYPDIPILVVDGDSNDDSLLYLRWKSVSTPNIKLWDRRGQVIGKFTSHGVTMHQAITNFIDTKYVLLLDSDVIVERGGWIEGMLEQIQGTDNMYATGTLMEVSDSNDAVGSPNGDDDILRYAHPSCSLYNAAIYKEMNVPFADHGSPCCYNMQEAKKLGYNIGYFPIDRYVGHCSGASWTSPRTVWNNDHDVFLRPFVSFIIKNEINRFYELTYQTSNDFEVVTALKSGEGHVILHENLVDVDVADNYIFTSRFNLRGEYVCVVDDNSLISADTVYLSKLMAIDKQAPDEFFVGNLKFTRRTIFQNKNAFIK